MTTDCEAVIEDYHTVIGTYFGTKPLVSRSTRTILCFDMTSSLTSTALPLFSFRDSWHTFS